ncbi:MAG TPA: aspartate-alanine antiporter [Methylomirabilota bacterium]|nr:aspartate-alanine antiporter [Methylomirabilota bacterium]
MDWVAQTLRQYPEIAILAALAIGLCVGPLKLGKFSLGNVTAVLLAGVLIGQLNITISPSVQSVFFLMFLFATGYDVGPQFFRGLKRDGLPQVIFACVLCLAVLLSTYVAASLGGYHAGLAAGLLSGAATSSGVLGVATDTINGLGLPSDRAKAWTDAMPIAYAVTYLFGTAGSAWFLAFIGPRLLGVDLVKECKDYERRLGGLKAQGGGLGTDAKVAFRAYRIASDSKFVGQRFSDLEETLAEPGIPAFVDAVRRGGHMVTAEPDEPIQGGDVLAIVAARETLLRGEGDLGAEVDDHELLASPLEIVDIVITNKTVAGKTLQQIDATHDHQGPGVVLRKLIRQGHEMPFTLGTTVDRGDVLQVIGAPRDVERAIEVLGYADRFAGGTGAVFMGLGIVAGVVVGAFSILIRGVPLSLSTSGGAFVAGLVGGYLRAVSRTFGRIPESTLWAFNNMGLMIFIAVVGISTGPGFLNGLREAGMSLFLWGMFVTVMPLIVAILAGKYVFKFHPGVLLGACAGARTTTAALGAIQDVAQSNVPALGYTITYAVGNMLLILWGVVIVLMLR